MAARGRVEPRSDGLARAARSVTAGLPKAATPYLSESLARARSDRRRGDVFGNLVEGESWALNEARLLGSRLLVVILFLGQIVCAYLLSRDAFGLTTARVIAFAFASSAGFIEYDHFLSCDSPLLFFLVLTLLLAFRIASSGKLSSYLLTGFFTDSLHRDQINGLAVGVSLVVAHLWSAERALLRQIVL